MTPEWIGIGISIAVALIAVGTMQARLAAVRAQTRKLEGKVERGFERQGERLGLVEGDTRVLFDRLGMRRRPTAAQGVPVTVEDGGSDE